MTPDELRHQLRRRAGLKGKRHQIPVRIVETPRSGNLIPPTLRKLGRRTEQREVVVSAAWLQKKAPDLWAAFVASRILEASDRIVISPLNKEDARGHAD